MGIEEGEVVEGEEGEGERGVDNGWRLEDWFKKERRKKKWGDVRSFFIFEEGNRVLDCRFPGLIGRDEFFKGVDSLSNPNQLL